VVIVNWNGRAHLLNCLASLVACTPQPDYVVVVDNASTDGSAQSVRDLHPVVGVIENSVNAGFAAANNQGAAEALRQGCDLVLFLNNDTLVETGALGEMAQAAATPGVRIVNPYITDMVGGVWFSGARVSRWKGEVAHLHEQAPRDAGLREIESATGCALLTDADTVREFGPFDEDYFIYYEDSDLSATVRSRGGRVVLQPAARIQHLVSADSLNNASGGFFYYLNTRNRLRFTRRHFSIWIWLVFVIQYTLSYVLPRSLALLVTGRTRNARALVRGYLDFYRGRFGPPRLD
jgi:GT2 family glycosyltransferase